MGRHIFCRRFLCLPDIHLYLYAFLSACASPGWRCIVRDRLICPEQDAMSSAQIFLQRRSLCDFIDFIGFFALFLCQIRLPGIELQQHGSVPPAIVFF